MPRPRPPGINSCDGSAQWNDQAGAEAEAEGLSDVAGQGAGVGTRMGAGGSDGGGGEAKKRGGGGAPGKGRPRKARKTNLTFVHRGGEGRMRRTDLD